MNSFSPDQTGCPLAGGPGLYETSSKVKFHHRVTESTEPYFKKKILCVLRDFVVKKINYNGTTKFFLDQTGCCFASRLARSKLRIIDLAQRRKARKGKDLKYK